MARKFLTSIDLNKNELQNAVIQNLGTAPSSPLSGQLYYNTTDNIIYVWNGTAWIDYSGDIKDVQGTLPITVNIVNGVATIDINNATGALDGAMSSVDKTKLDASTNINTASTLVERDASGNFSANRISVSDISITNAPSAGTDGTNKTYVDSLIDATLKAPEAYNPTATGNYPLTYGGLSIQAGDSFRITADTDSNGIGDGVRGVNTEDLLIAIVDAPSASLNTNWMVAESNRDQATETVKGVLEIATQTEVTTGTNDTNAITPLKLITHLNSTTITRKYATIFVGTGVSQTATITHNLNTKLVVVSIQDTATNEQVYADIKPNVANSLDITGVFGNGITYSVTVIG